MCSNLSSQPHPHPHTPRDHPPWHLCQKQSHKARGTEGHIRGESQLSAALFACGCQLEGLGTVLSALEVF